jgi:hypothetical protein
MDLRQQYQNMSLETLEATLAGGKLSPSEESICKEVILVRGYADIESKREAKRARKKGSYSWDGFLATKTGGCSPFYHIHDPLGYIHQPGDRIAVEGEAEI